ncbi:thiamin pyrophosphokinase 1-like [Uloborus diversus]|uniref:thiamin pyrophosphokinase 1-like n=1 Tax=Uloborus diversus TaxID=327109 RepID=UPI0024090624|nr:thiamin pyrophosphokinase 1-like [Uloborus diversus]
MNSNCKQSFKEWFPEQYINGEEAIALLILNQPISEINQNFVKKAWSSAKLSIAVDGGAIQLKEMSDSKTTLVPNIICGDFDSVTKEVLNFYQEKNVEIIHTPDQDETDFTKALRVALKFLKENHLQVSAIVAVAQNGDRLDHLLGNLNTLYIAEKMTLMPVLILGNASLTWLISPGHHKIHVSEKMIDSHIGLIPLGKECSNVSSTGLKWNLNHDKMKFGDLISTCNLFDGSGLVTVTTDTELLWTMEVNISEK